MARVKFSRTSIKTILDTYGERAVQAAKQALEENADIVVEEAKSRVPVKTGKLQASIHAVKKGENKIRIVADAKKKRYYYGNLIEYSPRGKPFMRPALEAKRDEIKQNMINKIKAALQ